MKRCVHRLVIRKEKYYSLTCIILHVPEGNLLYREESFRLDPASNFMHNIHG